MDSSPKEWSKSYLAKPEDQIISHVRINERKFVPSYEKNGCPADIKWLIGWEYGRVWLKEHDDFLKKRSNKQAPKRIENNFDSWKAKRTPKPKKR